MTEPDLYSKIYRSLQGSQDDSPCFFADIQTVLLHDLAAMKSQNMNLLDLYGELFTGRVPKTKRMVSSDMGNIKFVDLQMPLIQELQLMSVLDGQTILRGLFARL